MWRTSLRKYHNRFNLDISLNELDWNEAKKCHHCLYTKNKKKCKKCLGVGFLFYNTLSLQKVETKSGNKYNLIQVNE